VRLYDSMAPNTCEPVSTNYRSVTNNNCLELDTPFTTLLFIPVISNTSRPTPSLLVQNLELMLHHSVQPFGGSDGEGHLDTPLV